MTISIENAMEVFADFLTQAQDCEIVQTAKMGLVLIVDCSRKLDRSDLLVDQITDGDSLARTLLRMEMDWIYYSLNGFHEEPWNCTEETTAKVLQQIQPRAALLPPECQAELSNYFEPPVGIQI